MDNGALLAEKAVVMVSSSTPSLAMAQARQRLEDVIRIHEEGIRAHAATIVSVKMKLNECTLIARLPPELLSEIFVYYSAPAYNPATDSRPRPNSCPYTNTLISPNKLGIHRPLVIARVCHHWRTVALACPRLWSTIPVSVSAEYVHEMVARAKEAPLNVNIMLWTSQAALDAALGHGRLAQIRSLVVPFIPFTRGVELPTGMGSAPRMRAFIMERASATTLEAFEACAMPNLEELEMVAGVVPKWESPLLVAGMRRLVLSMGMRDAPGGASPMPQSLVHVLEVLGKMWQLEYLELQNVLPSGDDFQLDDRVVSLPKLKVLKLTAGVPACTALIQHLSFPAATSLTLDCSAVSPNISSFCTAVALKVAGIAGTGPTVILRTASFSTDGSIAHIKCWTSELEPSPDTLISESSSGSPSSSVLSPSTIPSPQLSIMIRSTSLSGLVAFTSLFAPLPLSDVRSLCIQTYSDHTLPTDGWMQCCSMPSLRSLSVGGWADGHLTDALASSIPLDSPTSEFEPATSKSGRKEEPFWPTLEELRMEGALLRPYTSALYDGPEDKNPRNTLLARLLRALARRKKYGHPLVRLGLTRCRNVCAADTKALLHVLSQGGEVTWDEQGEPSTEYVVVDYEVHGRAEDDSDDARE